MFSWLQTWSGLNMSLMCFLFCPCKQAQTHKATCCCSVWMRAPESAQQIKVNICKQRSMWYENGPEFDLESVCSFEKSHDYLWTFLWSDSAPLETACFCPCCCFQSFSFLLLLTASPRSYNLFLRVTCARLTSSGSAVIQHKQDAADRRAVTVHLFDLVLPVSVTQYQFPHLLYETCKTSWAVLSFTSFGASFNSFKTDLIFFLSWSSTSASCLRDFLHSRQWGRREPVFSLHWFGNTLHQPSVTPAGEMDLQSIFKGG